MNYIATAPNDMIQAHLQAVAEQVNACSYEALQYRNSCLLTSAFLAAVLTAEGYPDAAVVRIILTVEPADPAHGGHRACLGRGGEHFAVVVGRDWLVDATIDQVNNATWGSLAIGPVAMPLPEAFWDSPFGYAELCTGGLHMLVRRHDDQRPPELPDEWEELFEEVRQHRRP